MVALPECISNQRRAVQNQAPFFCDGTYIAEWASRQSHLCSDEAQSCPGSDLARHLINVCSELGDYGRDNFSNRDDYSAHFVEHLGNGAEVSGVPRTRMSRAFTCALKESDDQLR